MHEYNHPATFLYLAKCLSHDFIFYFMYVIKDYFLSNIEENYKRIASLLYLIFQIQV